MASLPAVVGNGLRTVTLFSQIFCPCPTTPITVTGTCDLGYVTVTINDPSTMLSCATTSSCVAISTTITQSTTETITEGGSHTITVSTCPRKYNMRYFEIY